MTEPEWVHLPVHPIHEEIRAAVDRIAADLTPAAQEWLRELGVEEPERYRVVFNWANLGQIMPTPTGVDDAAP